MTLSERLQPSSRRFRESMSKPLRPSIKPGTPLKDALDIFTERFELVILIDQQAFARSGIKDIEKQPVQLDKDGKLELQAALEEMLKQAGASFVLRENFVLVVPAKK